MIVFFVILNLLISTFNAWSVGHSWAEAKCNGGWAYFMAWCGGIMAACGFTWCYLAIIGAIANYAGWLPGKYLQGFYSLGYLAIILPILGSGLAIMVDSWAYFWRRKTFGSGALAGWNTFAQVYNTISALRGIPDALGGVVDMLDDDSDSKTGLAILLAIFAIAGGILTAMGIIRVTARRHARSVKRTVSAAARAEVAEAVKKR